MSTVNCEGEFLHSCISKILFIYTEQLPKMKISSQVFFKDFINRFRTTYLENEFLRSFFFKNFADRLQNSYLSKNWIA